VLAGPPGDCVVDIIAHLCDPRDFAGRAIAGHLFDKCSALFRIDDAVDLFLSTWSFVKKMAVQTKTRLPQIGRTKRKSAANHS